MFYRKALAGLWLCAAFILLGYGLLAEPYARWIRDEMGKHADDTASALASFITQESKLYPAASKTHWSNRQRAVILAYIESLVDGGDFKLIELRSPEGEVIVSRYHELQQDSGYFERWFHFPLTVETATVYRDWQNVGEVVVVPDEQRAHNFCAYWFAWYVLTWILLTLLWLLYTFWQHRKTARQFGQLAEYVIHSHGKPLNPKHFPEECRPLILALNERADEGMP